MLTLDDCQEDHDDKKEEGDVKDHAIYFVFIASWVLNLVSDTASCSHSYIHVEHVALEENTQQNQTIQKCFIDEVVHKVVI